MKRTDFSYSLPPERIAQEPRERGRSRMMVVTPTEGEPRIEHDTFADFPARLEPNDVVVINDTRVIPARLFAEPKGAMKRFIEVLLIRQLDAIAKVIEQVPDRKRRTALIRQAEAIQRSNLATVTDPADRDAVTQRYEGVMALILPAATVRA